jgi:hypothetical protein
MGKGHQRIRRKTRAGYIFKCTFSVMSAFKKIYFCVSVCVYIYISLQLGEQFVVPLTFALCYDVVTWLATYVCGFNSIVKGAIPSHN